MKKLSYFLTETKVHDVGSRMTLKAINCQSIHGSQDQCDREKDLKDGCARILLATDVASR